MGNGSHSMWGDVQTKPICRGLTGTPGPQVLPLGPIAPNKANFSGVSGEVNHLPEKIYGNLDMRTASEKQSQVPPGQHWADVGVATSAASEAYHAKQSQFVSDRPAGAGDQGCRCWRRWPQSRQTKPISPRASGEANALQERSYGELDTHTAPEEQKPIRARTALAKRRHGCRCCWRSLSCQTKPICPGSTRQGAGCQGRKCRRCWAQAR